MKVSVQCEIHTSEMFSSDSIIANFLAEIDLTFFLLSFLTYPLVISSVSATQYSERPMNWVGFGILKCLNEVSTGLFADHMTRNEETTICMARHDISTVCANISKLQHSHLTPA